MIAATAAFAAIALTACTGLPDKGFGSAGIASLPSVSNLEGRVTVLSDGKMMAVGIIPNSANRVVFRFRANGTVDATYASSGHLSVGISPLFIASDGRVYLFTGTPTATKLTGYTPAGMVDPAFGASGVDLPPNVIVSGVSPAGEFYLESCANAGPSASCSFHRYDKAGTQDPTFVHTLPKNTYGDVAAFGAGGSVFVLSYLWQSFEASHYVLTKLTHAGSPDVAFGNHGSIALPATVRVNSVIVDSSGRVTMLAESGAARLILRFTPQGHGDAAFGWLGMAAVPPVGGPEEHMTVDDLGRVLVTTSDSAHPGPVHIVRYRTDGRLDPTFGFGGTVTLSGVGTTNLLNGFVAGVATDSANRPVLSLDPDTGLAHSPAPALLRLTG